MRVITPVDITDSELISSTVDEPTVGTDPNIWVAGQGYLAGDSVYHATTHKVYTALTNITTGSAASNIPPPTDVQLAIPKWVEVGSTNRWNMFDVYRNTATIVDNNTATIVLGTPLEEETTTFDPYYEDNVVFLLQTYPANLGGYGIREQSKYNRIPSDVNTGTLTVDSTTMSTPSLNFGGGYVLYADSDDWCFPADFTVEVSLMFSTAVSSGTNRIGIIAQADAAGLASWGLSVSMDRHFVMSFRDTDNVNTVLTGTTVVQPNTEYFLAFVRKGSSLILYVNDQIELSTTITKSMLNVTSKLGIGMLGEYSYAYGGEFGTKMMGWIRIVRITKGVARYSPGFSVPFMPFAYLGTKFVPSNVSSAAMSMLDLYPSNVSLKLSSMSSIPPTDYSSDALSPTFTQSTGLAVDTSSMSVTSLDFTGGYVQYDHTPMYPGSGNFTWEFYVRFNSASTGDRAIIAGQASSSAADIVWLVGKYENETMYAVFKNTDSTTYVGVSYLKVTPNVDYYIVYERYGDIVTLYVNNVVYTRFTVSGAMSVSSSKMAIGKNGEDATGGYGGIGGTQMMGNIGYVRFTKAVARYTRALGGFLDSSKSLALLDLNNVGSVRVVCDYPSGTGYSTVSDSLYYLNIRDVYDWWTYFTTQFTPKKSLVLTDLPTGYANMRVTITFTGSTPMSIGTCIIGDSTFIGRLHHGAELDTLNFSTMERDVFGNAILVPRKEIATLSAKLYVDKTIFENVQSIKANLDAKPAVWVGLDDSDDPYYHALIFLGIYRSFNFQLDNPIGPTATLELEEM